MMIKKYSIPEIYNGIQMRSHLETLYAKIFDKYCIDYIYEADSYNLDGIWYKPDFYLTKSMQFFEVKGVMDEIDFKKIEQLCKISKLDVIVGHQDGKISGYFSKFQHEPISNTIRNFDSFDEVYFDKTESGINLFKCRDCGSYYFGFDCSFGMDDSCINCGEHKSSEIYKDAYFDLNKLEIRDRW